MVRTKAEPLGSKGSASKASGTKAVPTKKAAMTKAGAVQRASTRTPPRRRLPPRRPARTKASATKAATKREIPKALIEVKSDDDEEKPDVKVKVMRRPSAAKRPAAAPAKVDTAYWRCPVEGCNFRISKRDKNRSSKKFLHKKRKSKCGVNRVIGKPRGKPRTPIECTDAIFWTCDVEGCGYCVKMSDILRYTKKCQHKRVHAGKVRLPKSKIARRKNFSSRAHQLRQVWNGVYKRTTSGLKKKDLRKNVNGRIVSIKTSNNGKKIAKKYGFTKRWQNWCKSVREVRAEMGVEGFCKIKKAGTPKERNLYHNVLERMRKHQSEASEAQ